MPKKILVIIIFFFFSSVLQAEEFKLKKIVNLDEPWGSSFINENELIITEKKGKIKIINITSSEIFDVIHNLNFRVHGQGGLLDIIYKNNWEIPDDGIFECDYVSPIRPPDDAEPRLAGAAGAAAGAAGLERRRIEPRLHAWLPALVGARQPRAAATAARRAAADAAAA